MTKAGHPVSLKKDGTPRKLPRPYVKRSSYSDPETFIGWVNTYRKEHDATIDWLSQQTGISRPHLMQMFTGNRKIYPRTVETISKALKLDDDDRKHLHLLAARDMGFKL